jgi:hypothetical protein
MNADDLEGDDIWGDGSSGDDQGKPPEDEGEGGGGANGGNDSSSPTDVIAPVAASTSSSSALADVRAPVSLENDETRHMTIGELRQRIHLLNNDIRIMKSDVQRISHETVAHRERIRENQEKVKVNKQLPYLVANVIEILEPDAEDGKCLAPLKY